MLALLAVLWAPAPALRDGFLTKSICANVSYVSEATSQHDLHPVPTPHETCDIHGGSSLPCPPRTSPSTSWQLYHVLDRDKTIPFSQGTDAPALAWAGKLQGSLSTQLALPAYTKRKKKKEKNTASRKQIRNMAGESGPARDDSADPIFRLRGSRALPACPALFIFSLFYY